MKLFLFSSARNYTSNLLNPLLQHTRTQMQLILQLHTSIGIRVANFYMEKNFFGILYRTPPYFRTIPKKINQWKFQVYWTSLSGLPKHLYSTNAGAITSYTSIREILVTLIKKLLFNGLIGCLVVLLSFNEFFFIIACNDRIVLVLIISINFQHGTT